MSIDTASLAERMGRHGLRLRGALTFQPGDLAPSLETGAPAASLVLVGPVGGSLWPAFSAWHAAHPTIPDPLDSWSKMVVAPIAQEFEATAWYPSDPPYQPFQRWAMAAEGLAASPLGILIHPTYGLWHSYRAALGFSAPWPDLHLPDAARPSAPHPCTSCAAKPCLSHCPVGAVRPDQFDVALCRNHLATPEGKTGCIALGCLARNACPVGSGYRYPADQLRFHMAALRT